VETSLLSAQRLAGAAGQLFGLPGLLFVAGDHLAHQIRDALASFV
jgi:hypothetical protein